MPQFYTKFNSALGDMLLLSDGFVLTGLYFVGQKYAPDLNLLVKQDSLSIFSVAQVQLSEYFVGKRHFIDVAYRFVVGTPFQQKVWNAVTQVSYGKTLSYKELAASIELPKSIRAVAAAVGRNPMILVVPCHRIIGSDRALVGYAGGLERKNKLLVLEQKER